MVGKNKILITIMVLCILLLNACKSQVRYTKSGSPRPIKENAFSYAKKNFRLTDTLLIDTTAIYLLVDTTCDYCIKEKSTRYIRFFTNGKYISKYGRIAEIDENANDLDKGFVGYYYIKKNKILKLQYFPFSNSGITIRLYGFFENGDLWIYDSPAMVWSSAWLWKLLEGYSKKLWKKIKIDGLKPVIPDW